MYLLIGDRLPVLIGKSGLWFDYRSNTDGWLNGSRSLRDNEYKCSMDVALFTEEPR